MALAEISDRLNTLPSHHFGSCLQEEAVKLEGYRRRLYLTLRAMWGRDFLLQPHTGSQAFLQQRNLYLPEQLSAENTASAEALYRAMALHAAAHLMYTDYAVSDNGLSAIQRFLIGIVDDARVEYKAIQHDECLQKIWREQILQAHPSSPSHPVVAILQQLILGLLDNRYRTSNVSLNQWLADFHRDIPQQCDRPEFCVETGISLFNILSSEYPTLNMYMLNTLYIPYRDDNRLLWDNTAESRLETIPYRMQCLTQLGTETLPKTIYSKLARKWEKQKNSGLTAMRL